MTSIDDNSFHYQSLGPQAQSQRKTQPVYGISKVGREAREKVFISHDHSRAAALCRQSPIGGAIYDLPSTLDLKSGVGFSKGKSTEFLEVKGDEDIDTNHALGILVDSQQFKYGRDSTILIGTEPRGRLKDAELIKNHSAAFFGRESPGPAAIGDKFGPKFEYTKKRMGNAMPFGQKCSKPDWQKVNSMPDNVGPGMYVRKDIAVGTQHLSHRKNQAVNAFGKAEKFGKIRSADSVSLLDAAKSAYGKQTLSKNRSEPSIGFGVGTRDRRSRTAICMTKDDLGPKAFMPKPFHAMPRLPPEHEVMKAGWQHTPGCS